MVVGTYVNTIGKRLCLIESLIENIQKYQKRKIWHLQIASIEKDLWIYAYYFVSDETFIKINTYSFQLLLLVKNWKKNYKTNLLMGIQYQKSKNFLKKNQ